MWSGIARYAVKFGVVGLVGMGIDVGLFNALRLAAPSLPHAVAEPIAASIISVSAAILFNWLGNRYWTFRLERRRNAAAEFLEYLAVSLLGMLVALACLALSHYLLGFRSLLADNIAKNGIGLVLGTLVRFALMRYWVWGHHRGGRASETPTWTAARDSFAPTAGS